jgi:hypothetical protein
LPGRIFSLSVPSFGVPLGLLDLLGSVPLPDAVDPHAGRAARRFGDAPPDDPGRRGAATPEPTTGLLLLLGLVGLERIGCPRS